MIGVWAGRAALKSPGDSVEFCVDHGIQALHIIVNDHSRHRRPRGFDTYDRVKLWDLADQAHLCGLEVHLMSWIMPHAGYLTQAAKVLVPLCEDLKAKSLQFDAEEPWTLAARPRMTYNDAASLVAELFADLPCQLGVNAIGYTPKLKVGPLIDVASYVVPQCYSTRTQPLKPETVATRLVRRWHDVLDARTQEWKIGLAAYRQQGIPGHTIESAMQAAYTDAREYSTDVIYWWLPSIMKSKRIARVIRGLA